jgi:hypothetical protein
MTLPHARSLEPPEPDGWTPRFTAFGQRLGEATALYQQLGYEVRLEAVEPGTQETANAEACLQCVVMTLARTIYTRPKPGGNAAEQE